MCILCIEIAKGKMTTREMVSAYVEIAQDENHATEILGVLEKYGKRDQFEETLIKMATAEINEGDEYDDEEVQSGSEIQTWSYRLDGF